MLNYDVQSKYEFHGQCGLQYNDYHNESNMTASIASNETFIESDNEDNDSATLTCSSINLTPL